MTRPLLLDLFCGAGGAAVGYHQAGFDVIGIDIDQQPHYPYPFIQGDALQPPVDLAAFDAIHASPPCPAYSVATPAAARNNHPDLVGLVRQMLASFDGPTVIENVPGSPVRPDLILCGSMFNLPIRRHRLFELGGWFVMQHGCSGHDGDRPYTVSGHLGPTIQDYRHSLKPSMAEACEIMGLHPDTPLKGITNAIPPAYTEYVGLQLANHIQSTTTKDTL